MSNFWESSVWGNINLIAVLLIGLLVGNLLKKKIPFLAKSLIPTSVLGGVLVLAVSNIYRIFAGISMFDTMFFNENGTSLAEILTYHCLALGFIAAVFKPSEKLKKERVRDVFNTGITTVSTYLVQGVLGLGITIVWALFQTDKFAAAGIILPFGYGQGSGQALNWGSIYETDYGFAGGRSFGLTIAALGFLSAAIGGVIYLNIAERKGLVKRDFMEEAEIFSSDEVQKTDEIPMNGSIDKLTVQLGFVFGSYFVAYVLIRGLGNLAGGLRSVLYGFNFLFGVLIATLVNFILGKLKKGKILQKQYINEFLMKRISGFFFDLMIVAGIAAIKIEMIKEYWLMIVVLGLVGALVTFFYNWIVSKTLFKGYAEEQFLAMYGMLTGTASTGIILLREIDPSFSTPASENMVYQNFPAIIFGFPMMFLAAFAPKNPLLTLSILLAFFVVMNLTLFRSRIFRKKVKE